MEHYTETIEFKLEMPGRALPIEELISYLENIRILMESINHTLNQRSALGYDKIEVQLQACKEGSFRIPAEVHKFLKNPMVNTIGGALLSYALPILFSGDGEQNEEVPIEKRYLLENSDTKTSVANIAQLVVANDSIQSLSLVYNTNAGEQKVLNVSKETLQKIATHEEEEDIEENEEQTLYRKRVELISPVLKPEEAKWRMKFDKKTRDVTMSDQDFIARIDEDFFAAGDTFIVDLVVRKERGKHDSYRIVRVHEHRHKQREPLFTFSEN